MFIALCLLIFLPVYAYSGQIGKMAPSFHFVGSNGNAVTLEQFKGKVVFLAFWAPWCIPCKEELPELEKLYQMYGKDGFEVIAISIESSDKNIAAFLKKVPLSVHFLIDKKNEVSDAYRVSSLPTGFIIGRDGMIKFQHRGFDKESPAVYEKEVVELLKQY